MGNLGLYGFEQSIAQMAPLTLQILTKPFSEVLVHSLKHCHRNFGDLGLNIVFEGLQSPGTIVINQ